MEKRAFRAEGKQDEGKDKIKQHRHKIYELETALEEEKGKNSRLKAQLGHDHENSSIPSSKGIRRKKSPTAGKRQGKSQEVSHPPILLDPPQEVLEDPDFHKTAKPLAKQLVNIRLVLEVEEYHANACYNPQTGKRVHAAFPSGVVNEVNYGGSIKAFLFLLNHDCCASIDKSLRFLSDLTDGKLKLSKGMANKLGRESASKTQEEREKIFSELLLSPVMHVDCTNAVVYKKGVFPLFVDLTRVPGVKYSRILYLSGQKYCHFT